MKVLTCGLACFDIIKDNGKEVFMLGGTAANVVSILSKLGANASYLFPRYNNGIDEQFRYEFDKRNIELIEFATSRKPIPRIIENLENGKHKFEIICPKCNNKLINVILPTEAHICKLNIEYDFNLFYYDRISAGIKVINLLNKDGWNMYEPNSSRSYNTLLQNAKSADILKISGDMIPQTTVDRLINDLSDGKTKIVIVTLGKKGVKFSTRLKGELSDWSYISVQENTVVKDTSGAGDWLSAIFLYNFLKKYTKKSINIEKDDIEHFLKEAQEIAAMSCMYTGAQGMLYSEDGVNELNSKLSLSIEKIEATTLKNGFCTYCGI